jgi:hypothetical protein
MPRRAITGASTLYMFPEQLLGPVLMEKPSRGVKQKDREKTACRFSFSLRREQAKYIQVTNPPRHFYHPWDPPRQELMDCLSEHPPSSIPSIAPVAEFPTVPPSEMPSGVEGRGNVRRILDLSVLVEDGLRGCLAEIEDRRRR